MQKGDFRVNSRVRAVISYYQVDIGVTHSDSVGTDLASSEMSSDNMTLPANKLVTIIQAFCHELSTGIQSYEGSKICR